MFNSVENIHKDPHTTNANVYTLFLTKFLTAFCFIICLSFGIDTPFLPNLNFIHCFLFHDLPFICIYQSLSPLLGGIYSRYSFIYSLILTAYYFFFFLYFHGINIQQYSFLIIWWLWKEPFVILARRERGLLHLAAEAVQCTTLPLQCIHHVHGCDSLSLGVLAVGDCITDDILQEDLQYTACLFVDKTWDPLDTSPSSKSTDCRLGDALDVVS